MNMSLLRSLVCGLAFAACFCPRQTRADDSSSARPNVLLILIDDLGPEWLSSYGGELLKTPHIDALAAAGTRFSTCYATPLCSTTRAMLLTGLYPRSTGWIWHHDPSVYGGGGFDWERYVTLPRIFKQAGYATSLAGKWQINNLYEQPESLARHGFDEHCVWPGAKQGEPATESRYGDPYILENGRAGQRPGQFGEDVFAEFTIDFMRRNRERPFLAWHALHLTHTPFTTTPANADDSAAGADLFPGMVRYADQIVGRLLAALDNLALRDKTIVLLTTDNGSAGACRGRMQGREVRGGKGSLRETGIHVPLMVRAPGVAAGRASDQPIDFTDVLPTLLDLCGIARRAAAALDGQSLVAILSGKAESLRNRDWAHTQYAQTRVVRDRRYKLYSSGPLYDLLEDPSEQHDLAASASPEVAAARQRLAAVLASFPADATLPFKPRSQSYFQAHPEDRPPGTAAAARANEPLTFCVMGDVPYAPREELLLTRQLAELPAQAAFAVHLGDIKAGGSPCDEAIFSKVAGLLAKSPRPLFIVPGDNEWNDCLEPANAWSLWERHFLKFDERWRHGLPVARQPSRAENFAFLHSSVLFVGINLVGGKVHDAAEWQARHAANLAWIKLQLAAHGRATHLVLISHAKPIAVHDDFITGFEQIANDFAKPVLYLHGDGHQWIHDRPFAAKNILRVQVDSGGLAPPISVTLSGDAQSPFQLDRRNGLLPSDGPVKKPAPVKR